MAVYGFPNDQALKFATLERLEGEILHAEGNWENSNAPRRVAVVFGPQYGAVTAKQVEECLPIASQRGYEELVVAGFSFDALAQDVIDADPNPRVHAHMAYINPDVDMDDLLEQTSTSQLFTVFGAAANRHRQKGQWGVYRQDGGCRYLQSGG